MSVSTFASFITFLIKHDIVLPTTFLYGLWKLNNNWDFPSLLSFVLSRYVSKVSIIHNWESSGKPMSIRDGGGLPLRQRLLNLAKGNVTLLSPFVTLYQGVANLKHEKLLLMKVTYKAYKSVPDQSVN